MEWLGNEAYAYIPFEAPPEVEKQLQQLERDLDGESLRTQLVVGLDGASRISEGDEATIWVDARKIHLFDPASGDNLTIDTSNARHHPRGQPDGEGRGCRATSRTRCSRARTPPPPDPRSSGPAGRRGTRPREHRSRGLAASDAPSRRPQTAVGDDTCSHTDA